MHAPRHALDWEAVSLRVVFVSATLVPMVFLIAPTIIVLITSLTASESLKFPPSGLSLRWYYALLDADQMQRAAWNSLTIACWTTLISVVLGTGASLAIARSRSKWPACDLCSCRRCCFRRWPRLRRASLHQQARLFA